MVVRMARSVQAMTFRDGFRGSKKMGLVVAEWLVVKGDDSGADVERVYKRV
jgi:hypothetical protein